MSYRLTMTLRRKIMAPLATEVGTYADLEYARDRLVEMYERHLGRLISAQVIDTRDNSVIAEVRG